MDEISRNILIAVQNMLKRIPLKTLEEIPRVLNTRNKEPRARDRILSWRAVAGSSG